MVVLGGKLCCYCGLVAVGENRRSWSLCFGYLTTVQQVGSLIYIMTEHNSQRTV